MLCGAIGATVFQSSSKRVSVVIAARNLPAGTVLTAADLATGSLPANDNITAMSASGASVLIGQQLAVPTTQGQFWCEPWSPPSHASLPAHRWSASC